MSLETDEERVDHDDADIDASFDDGVGVDDADEDLEGPEEER